MGATATPDVLIRGLAVNHYSGTFSVSFSTEFEYQPVNAQGWQLGNMSGPMIDRVRRKLNHHFDTAPLAKFSDDRTLGRTVSSIASTVISEMIDETWEATPAHRPVETFKFFQYRPDAGTLRFEKCRAKAEKEATAIEAHITAIVARISNHLRETSPSDSPDQDTFAMRETAQYEATLRDKASEWILDCYHHDTLGGGREVISMQYDRENQCSSGTVTLTTPGETRLVVHLGTGHPRDDPSL